MLLRFAVENFKSFNEQQVFSMVAGKYTKHNNHILSVKGKRLLKGSFLFGANASGKSNLLEAVSFAQNIVINGIKNTSLTNKHFRIDSTLVTKPGVFQFDIFSNGHFYSYGFAISYQKASIDEEWLYLCDIGELAIFERFIEDGKRTIRTDYSFSTYDQAQRFKIYSEGLPDDCLFLSEIAERKLVEYDDFSAYKDIQSWFQRLEVIFPGYRYVNKNLFYSDKTIHVDMAKLLYSFDTGIEDIEIKRGKAENILDSFPEVVKKNLIEEAERHFNKTANDNKQPISALYAVFDNMCISFEKKENQLIVSQLMMNHGNKDDLFEMKDESDGTQRLFDLIPVYAESKHPKVIFVDELDRSFHTMLVQRYIENFYRLTDGIESQLIATVHDSNIMNLDLLRQDEIWFVERMSNHASKIFSLSKYKERFDKKVSKDYLLGRYGAIPCIEQIDFDMEGT